MRQLSCICQPQKTFSMEGYKFNFKFSAQNPNEVLTYEVVHPQRKTIYDPALPTPTEVDTTLPDDTLEDTTTHTNEQNTRKIVTYDITPEPSDDDAISPELAID